MRALFYTLFTLTLIVSVPVLVVAAEPININTAEASLLETLPGIGTTKASAIVDYRTQNGLFGTTADIQKVSGIGASTYAEISSLITVGDTTTALTTSTTTPASTGTAVTPSVPQDAWVDMGGDVTVTLHVPHTFYARVRSKNNTLIADTDVHWSFGDGSSGTGTAVKKTFEFAGTYVVTASILRGSEKIQGAITVQVTSSFVRIDSVSSEGVMITNEADTVLDLSRWRITTDKGFFVLPEGTELAPGASVLFPWSIMALPVSFSAYVLYPSGMLAARYDVPTPLVVVQPASEDDGSYTMKAPTTVAISSQRTNTHEEAGALAPATTTTMAAAGAPQRPLSDQVAGALPQAEKAGLTKFISSPWSFGFLGVLAVSVGAFILL